MSDATHGLPIHRPDPDFGRAYGRPGDAAPRLGLPSGWWLLPSLAGGLAGWVILFRALFF
ncbi:MAG: hypothetical protein O9292_03445 [Rhodobacteraceae bacterium]|jgi:hypothetical protein|nr:hypothetical protein [Paracoccaceae bacterium]MCZ8151441.1 hypothetical protein [Paracoccaceae bacterium]MCZ8335297.1 hypothetical protein [Paracoccaceae bacterium]